VKELTASEAARHFSAVLDGVEDGGSYVVTRGGRRVAMIVPATRANGGAVVDLFRRWHGKLVLDEEFRHAVGAAGDNPAESDPDRWRA
jgi:prevent-host-death family protein